MSESENTGGRKKSRSPSYPAVNLKSAIDRARVLWEKEHGHPTPVATIYAHWGYSPGSGPGNLTIASLRKFGLITYEGSRGDRRGKLTDLCMEVLVHPDEVERLKAIQKAALLPSIHQEMWSKYGGALPTDDNLRWVLLRDYNFTPGGAADFIDQYRVTLEFAQLLDTDTTYPVDSVESSEAPTADEDRQFVSHHGRRPTDEPWARQRQTPEPRTPTSSRYVIPAGPRIDVVVEGPFPLTSDQWKQFRTVLDAMEPALAVPPNPEEAGS